jgi:hypothetical protein
MLISKNFLTREASYKPSYFTSWSQSGPLGTRILPLFKGNDRTRLLLLDDAVEVRTAFSRATVKRGE